MKLQPLGQRVLVSRQQAPAITAGGLYLPDSAAPVSRQGTVTAVGSETDPSITVGATVLLPEHGGTEVRLDGQVFSLYGQEDILAVIG